MVVRNGRNLKNCLIWAFCQKVSESAGVFVGGYRDKKDQLHYLRHDGPEHVIAIAPTRSGKGVGLVLPTMLTWQHSMLISDIKGELWNYDKWVEK